MTRPLIGIMGNAFLINEQYPAHVGGSGPSEAVAKVSDAIPVIIPSEPDYATVEELCASFDGFLFPGGRANVHPEEYGEEETEAHGTFDRGRDRVSLPLIRALIARGQPCFGICRGFQDMNVAMGGSLYPEIRELPGRMNHRMPPDGTLEEKFELRHSVTFSENGPFHRLMGDRVVMTNTLHGQGIKVAGARVIIDGHADDGTPEAIYIDGAPGFALAVQWHPEWNAAADPVSRPLFEAFGEAARAWKAGARPAAHRQSA